MAIIRTEIFSVWEETRGNNIVRLGLVISLLESRPIQTNFTLASSVLHDAQCVFNTSQQFVCVC